MQAPASRKVSVRYIKEDQMEALAYNASLQEGFEPSTAMMLAACTRNIYAIGTGYHPTTVTLIEKVCREQAKEGAAWAMLMLEVLAGRMPRLRSEKTAAARSAAASRASAAKRAAKHTLKKTKTKLTREELLDPASRAQSAKEEMVEAAGSDPLAVPAVPAPKRVIAPKIEAGTPAAAEKPTETFTAVQLMGKKVDELRELCRARGLQVAGKKQELVDRLATN
jgi:hypothetical protein